VRIVEMDRRWCIVATFALLAIAGCAAPKTIVYGSSGKQFLAPDLCGAVVACRQANEKECLYNATTVTALDGKSTETYTCKVAKK
jgi:hypothetical protein